MAQLLRDRFGQKKKEKKKGLLFLIIGSLLALIATVGFILATSLLTGVVIESRHGGETAYAIMTIVFPCYGVAMMLFYGILAVWYITPTPSDDGRGLSPMLGKTESKGLSKKHLWLITGGLLVGVLLTGLVAVNTYRLVTPDGVSEYCFVRTEHHTWEEVSAYSIGYDNSTGLTVTFTMKDGDKPEILSGVRSTTRAFDKAYKSPFELTVELHRELTEKGVFCRDVTTAVYNKAVGAYKDSAEWPYVSELIDYEELTESE